MTLEERLAGCTSTTEMQEMFHQHLAASGAVELERGSNSVRVLSEPRIVERVAPTPTDAPANRIRYVYPHGNVRVEIQATSEKELDALEARVRALYQ